MHRFNRENQAKRQENQVKRPEKRHSPSKLPVLKVNNTPPSIKKNIFSQESTSSQSANANSLPPCTQLEAVDSIPTLDLKRFLNTQEASNFLCAHCKGVCEPGFLECIRCGILSCYQCLIDYSIKCTPRICPGCLRTATTGNHPLKHMISSNFGQSRRLAGFHGNLELHCKYYPDCAIPYKLRDVKLHDRQCALRHSPCKLFKRGVSLRGCKGSDAVKDMDEGYCSKECWLFADCLNRRTEENEEAFQQVLISLLELCSN